MVPGAGIEPARRLRREILSLLCLPISPSGQKTYLTFKEHQSITLVYNNSDLLSNIFSCDHIETHYRIGCSDPPLSADTDECASI